MIAKITKGKSFGGCVKYVATKQDAELLGAIGVLIGDHRIIAESMETQARINPKLGKKVGHISLNFSAQDKDKLTNPVMKQIAWEYMTAMGIRDTQLVVYRHNDREHPHCHIVYNRVSNSGKTISDQNDRIRSTRICRSLTEKYGLYIANGKENVKQQRLREPDKTKYAIYNSITAGLRTAKSWNELADHLRRDGISLTFKTKGNSNEPQGVVFTKNGQSFNGSKIDRQYSFSKLDARLKQNAIHPDNRPALSPSVNLTTRAKPELVPRTVPKNPQTRQTPAQTHSYEPTRSHDSPDPGFSPLFDIGYSGDDDDNLNLAELERRKRLKNKKRIKR